MEPNTTNLNDILKQVNKKFNAIVAQIGVPELRQKSTLSLGSPSLDFCLFNSLPEGTFIEFNGLESSGKTTTAFLVAASYMKKELERHPENPRKILFVDAECATDPEWALKATGYDMNDTKVPTIYVSGAGQSAEEYFDIVIDFLKTGEIGLVIFDSLSMIAGKQIVSESMEKQQMGGIAKILGDFCKRAVGLLNRYRTTFIGINGLNENIGGYGDPLVTGGGRTWKRACMVRLRFKRGDFFDEEGNTLTKSAQSPAGNIIEMYVEKTKVCEWSRKLGFLHLNYSKGVDLLWDTIEVATYLGLIKQINQMTFAITDPDTGEILRDEKGEELKIKGKKNLKPYFLEHLDLWRKLYDKSYEMFSKKNDPNIVAFEKMLNIDIEEKLGYVLNSQED